jgi:hypothetical protein
VTSVLFVLSLLVPEADTIGAKLQHLTAAYKAPPNSPEDWRKPKQLKSVTEMAEKKENVKEISCHGV